MIEIPFHGWGLNFYTVTLCCIMSQYQAGSYCTVTCVFLAQLVLVETAGTVPEDDIMTLRRTICWQAAEQQAASGARSSCVRWSKLPTTVENIRSISSVLALPLQKVPVMKFLNVVCDICHEVLLQISSILSGAEKLNCTSLRGHDSLFPLSTLHPNYSVHPRRYKSWQTAWERSTLFIIQMHKVSILSVCTASADVQIFPQAQFHPLPWRILGWRVDDMRVEKANE